MHKRFLTIVFSAFTACLLTVVTEVNASTTPTYIGIWNNTVSGETLAILKGGVFINNKGQKGNYKIDNDKNQISIFSRTYKLKHEEKHLELITDSSKMQMKFERIEDKKSQTK